MGCNCIIVPEALFFFTFFFLKNPFIFIYLLFLVVLGLRCSKRFSRVAASGTYPLVAALRLPLRWPLSLQSVGSGAQGSVAVARGLQSASSTVVPYGFSCSTACRIFPDQGSNSRLLHWQEPLGNPPKPSSAFPVLHYLCKACS